jgi:hypothetical protein
MPCQGDVVGIAEVHGEAGVPDRIDAARLIDHDIDGIGEGQHGEVDLPDPASRRRS